MEKLRPRAILFDLGSTLIEYETVSWDELSETCVKNGRRFLAGRGIEVPPDGVFERSFDEIRQRYRQQAANTFVEWDIPQVVAELFDRLGIHHTERTIDEFFDAYYEKVAELLFAYDDAADTLARLKERYPTIGLISNTVFPERAHLAELDRFGLARYLDFTIFSSSFGLRKPHRDIFLKAANMAGQAPSDCVYIGDRYLEDIEGPHGVGMAAILKVKEDREYPDEMPLATRRVSTLTELFEHIES